MNTQTSVPLAAGMRLLKLKDVLERTSLSTATVYRRQGKTFPKSYHLDGSNRVVWLESDIEDWIAAQLSQSG